MARPAPAATAAHVEAYCSTGTSPGSGSIPLRLELELGGTLYGAVHYTWYGPLLPGPTLVLGGISAGRHLAPTDSDAAPGWWSGVIGDGAVLDPARVPLLGVDFVTAGPSAGGPGRITTWDQARAVIAVLDALDVERVAVVGASYGGMVGLALAALVPERVSTLVALCAAHRTHPMATALRVLQRRIAAGGGLELARALAMTTYRSAEEFDRRFSRRPTSSGPTARFPVEAYLDARGRDYAARTTSSTFLQLSTSIDLHDVDPASIEVPTTLVSADTDALVPPWLVDELAAAAPGVVGHVTLETVYGHDAFLKEVDLVSSVLGAALDRGGAR